MTGVAFAMVRNRSSLSRSLSSASRPRRSARTVASSTGGSTGCPTVGNDPEILAPKAVIDWLNGRAKGFTTLELNVNLVRALDDKVLMVRAEGKAIHVGRPVATAKGRIVGPDGKLHAHATTTCQIFDLPATT